MRYFYDTEFIEDGRTIELVSIGIVAEDGREYYAVSTDFDASRATAWVRDNVLDKLPTPGAPVVPSTPSARSPVLPHSSRDDVELWAWVGAYDHVVLAQLWGDMAGRRVDPRYARAQAVLGDGREAASAEEPGCLARCVGRRPPQLEVRICAEVLPLRNRVLVKGAKASRGLLDWTPVL